VTQERRFGPVVAVYSGRALDHALVCPACGEAYAGGADLATASLCAACVDELWPPDRAYGSPGVLERPEPVDATVRSVAPDGLPADLLDVGCADGPEEWYGLCADGTVVALGADFARARPVAAVTLPQEPETPWSHLLRRRLHVAHGGDHAAVVNDHGQFGSVVDLRDGSQALALDSGDSHRRTVPFPLAFARLDGRDVVVHATDWNRLDVSDPATGAPLTGRELPSYGHGEECHEHYLDYFHGALHLSPGCGWLLDDGWAWYPVGVVTVWSLDRWLRENVWESEDGPTRRDVCWRDSWGLGMCWLDERYVAVSGIGDDDAALVDGARVFDATAHAAAGDAGDRRQPTPEVRTFAGPSGAFFGDGPRLYSAGEDGLSRWDVATGARTARIDGFRPSRQSRTRGELVEVRPREVAVWRYAAPGAPPPPLVL
jgi:hypothetical protein